MGADSRKPRAYKPQNKPEETAVLLKKELRRRGMNEVEIDAALRKKKRSKVLIFNAVKSKHLVHHPDLKPQRRRRLSKSISHQREPATRVSGELCTVHFAADQLKLHRKTVLRFIREGRLPATRIGKSYRIKRSDLEAFSGLPAQMMTPAELASITSIVDIPDVGPDLAKKWQSTVASALQARSLESGAMRAEVIYEVERAHVKIIVVGPPSDSIHLLSLVRVWMEQLRP